MIELPIVDANNAKQRKPDWLRVKLPIGEEYKKLNDSEKTIQYFKKAYDVSEKNNLFNNLKYLSSVKLTPLLLKKEKLSSSLPKKLSGSPKMILPK